ncbi:MAG: Dna2/Cas4 domain-containing protein, partial [Bryobacterales bacterium]|nr:Dna2/Cas4 domain-containing protein [Bryobacterales bacterium]
GRKPDKAPVFVGGGRTLQPALYAMALEQIKDAPVQEGRLFYCTHRGGFDEIPIKLLDATRAKAERAVEIIGEWVEEGFLPPAPAEEECGRCDYRLVCGPYEELRLKKKPAEPLGSLVELRGMP